MFKKFSFLFVALFTVFSLAFTSCGDDDDDDQLSGSSIIGTWEASYDDGDDIVTETFTFRKNGTVVNTLKSTKYPEDNYSVTLNYSITGDVEDGAIIKLWGKDADGEYAEVEAYAKLIDDNSLMLDNEGSRLVLHRK